MDAEDSTREEQPANQMVCWSPLSKTKSICAVEPKGFTLGKKVTFAPWVLVCSISFSRWLDPWFYYTPLGRTEEKPGSSGQR